MELSERLVDVVIDVFGADPVHTLDASAADAVAALLDMLANYAMPAIYNTDQPIWYAGELRILANKIKESNG